MKKLKDLIGKVALVEGKKLRLIEVYLDDETVILEDATDSSELQENAFGDIHRRTNKTYSVPFYSEVDKHKLHPVVELFLAAD